MTVGNQDLVNEVNYAQKDRDALKAKLSKAVDQSKTAAKILAELQKRNDITKKAEKNDVSHRRKLVLAVE